MLAQVFGESCCDEQLRSSGGCRVRKKSEEDCHSCSVSDERHWLASCVQYLGACERVTARRVRCRMPRD